LLFAPPLFELHRVTVAYGERALFHELSFSGPRSRLVGIVGPSGAGKSTLLNLLAGLDRPIDGSVRVLGREVPQAEGRELAEHRARVGLVLQSGNLLGHQTAEENAALPMLLRGVRRRDALAQARAFLARLGLAGLERRYPSALSGGEAQRVAVARALACGARVILADEPTASLDPESSRQVFAALALAAKSYGRGVVIVSHDPRVHAACDEVLEIRAGKLERVRDFGAGDLLDLDARRSGRATQGSEPERATLGAPWVLGDTDSFRDSFAGAYPDTL